MRGRWHVCSGLSIIIIAERKWIRHNSNWSYGIIAKCGYQTHSLGMAMYLDRHLEAELIIRRYLDKIMFRTATYPEISLIKNMLHPNRHKRLSAHGAKTTLSNIKSSGQCQWSSLYAPIGIVSNFLSFSKWCPGSHYN